MNIIVCVDKSGGMMFNNRRLSQDKELTAKVIELSNSGRLLMNEYSKGLFKDEIKAETDNSFLSNATEGDFCFVENEEIPIERAEAFYVFNWNRDYPADKYFEVDLKMNGFKRVKKEDFVGNSHKKITLEIYKKV